MSRVLEWPLVDAHPATIHHTASVIVFFFFPAFWRSISMILFWPSLVVFSGQRTRSGHWCSTTTWSWPMCEVPTLRSPTPWPWTTEAAWSSWRPWLTARSTVNRRWPTTARGPACSTRQVRTTPAQAPLRRPCRMTAVWQLGPETLEYVAGGCQKWGCNYNGSLCNERTATRRDSWWTRPCSDTQGVTSRAFCSLSRFSLHLQKRGSDNTHLAIVVRMESFLRSVALEESIWVRRRKYESGNGISGRRESTKDLSTLTKEQWVVSGAKET